MSKAAIQGYPTITLTTPVPFQVIQRAGTTGTIAIAGTASGGSGLTIEARFNSGAWATIATGVSGSFSGSLSAQPQGHGTLEVRAVRYLASLTNVANVGIGDVFIVAGQSNASGRGTSNQSYSGSPGARLFGNDYVWKNLADPTDSSSGQIDTVSSDASAAGSVWPLIATSYLTSQAIPIAFVPCALGSTTISQWQPGANHQDRTTLYGSMVYRALQTGAKAVLWWQGESDVGIATSQASYAASLTALANALFTDLGVPLMPCTLQNTDQVQADEDAINAAIAAAWGTGHILTGPDLRGIATLPEDTVHLITNAKLLSAAALWWSALQATFGYS